MSAPSLNINGFSPFSMLKWILIFIFLSGVFFKGKPDLTDAIADVVRSFANRPVAEQAYEEPK